MLLPHHNMTDRAWAIAILAHEGQVDKAGRSYSLHLMKVSQQMKTETEEAVAMLHDVLEDTDWTEGRLHSAGIPQYIIEPVKVLTHRKGEYYSDYINRIAKDEIAVKVKIADLEHNMDITRLNKDLTKDDMNRLQKYHRAWMLLRKISNA